MTSGGHGGLGAHSCVAVTGGCGFIGSHLVQALLGLGAAVRIIDRDAGCRADADAEFVRADLRDPLAADVALASVDVVFHLAGNSDALLSLDDPAADFAANAVTTFNVMCASRRNRVRRVVFLSSGLVYGRPAACPVSEREKWKETIIRKRLVRENSREKEAYKKR